LLSVPDLQAMIDAPTSELHAFAGVSSKSVSSAMYLSWLAQPDLQARFDLSTHRGRQGLARWCRQQSTAARRAASQVQSAVDRLVTMFGNSNPRLPGCNLVGYSRGVLGMGEHVRMASQSMIAAGVPSNVIDYSLGLGSRRQSKEVAHATGRRATRRCTIMHVNADQMVRAYWHFGPRFFESRYVVGYWAWELERFPDEWHPVVGLVDEIWAPSAFVKSAIEPLTAKPVIHMPLCVELPPFSRLPRAAFGLLDTEFVFTFAFDCHSWLSRKNPVAIIKAFTAAFGANEPVRLILKAMHGRDSDPQWQALVALAAKDQRIMLINEVWPRERLLALVASADAYVSLHRSEGFGRGPAEAMLLGKPVIVTAYSGTRDFCGKDNCLPVGFQLVEVKAGEYPHGKGQHWAEPNIEEGADQMRRLFDDRNLATRIGEAGRETISREFCANATGWRYRARLDEIGMLNEQELK